MSRHTSAASSARFRMQTLAAWWNSPSAMVRSRRFLSAMMHHAAIHGVHHRGQVAMLLRSLGYVPGDFDMLFYYVQLRQS
ncbi:MAG TPA: DinB family protein [Bryobacteraceae bacterium]